MMNRRMFFPWIAERVSGSFLVGTVGGLSAGSAAVYGADAKRPWENRSYSQQGEDLIIESICQYLRIENPTYLDVGAADPIRLNNTYLFYRKGGRGVLVEPNPSQVRKLRSTRPRDTVLNIGIGFTAEKSADYYMIDGTKGEDLNTFSKEQADSYAKKTKGRHSLERVIKMPLVNINQVMEDYFESTPDFVSIDTEGLDLDILKSLDFKRFRPSIFCVETLVFGTKAVESEILKLMQSKDYTVRGSTFVNTIFVDDHCLV